MKNKLLTSIFLISLFLTKNIIAQDKYSKYDSEYFKKQFDISITNKKTDKYSLYVDMMSMDKLCDKGGIILDEKQHAEFLLKLNDAKNKYEEWVKTALENDVKELEKTMSFKTKCSAYFLYGSKWNFQFYVNLTFDFKIVNDKYMLIIRTGELTSSSNQFMNVDGFVFVFTSLNEIDEFINVLSADKVLEYITKPKTDEIFKD